MNMAKVDCPHCLGSSGILADGLGTHCRICAGKGTISQRKMNEYNDMLKELV